MIVQRDRVLRHRHHPDRKFHRIAGKTARQPFAVPALVDLAEIFTDLLRQADPFGDPLRDLTVTGQNRDVDLWPLGEAALDLLCQFLRRRAGKLSCNGPDKDFDEFGSVAHVDVMKLAAQGDLVAPGVRQQMRVGIASDVAQQRLMKDAATHLLVKTRDVREPHRQHA